MPEELLKKTIGKAARRARVSLGLTQEDVAERIGVSIEFYSRIERGAALPGLETFIAIALALQVGTDKLLGLTEDEEAQRLIKEYSVPPPDDKPLVKRMIRRLRTAPDELIKAVIVLYSELENLWEGGKKRSQKSEAKARTKAKVKRRRRRKKNGTTE